MGMSVCVEGGSGGGGHVGGGLVSVPEDGKNIMMNIR